MIDDRNNTQIHEVRDTQTRTSPWTVALGASVLLLGGVAFYEGNRTDTLKQELASAQHDNAAVQANLTSSYDAMQKNLANLKEDMAAQQQAAGKDIAKTQTDARRHADQVVAKLEQKHSENERQLTDELNQVKASADDTSAKLTSVTTDVGDVKTDVDSVKTNVASVRTDTDKNQADLSRALGDMGVMSGLIATNSGDIKFLRSLGDRNIYEFTINRSGGMQKVGDIQVALDKSDAKCNKFTVDILADDKRVQKKDKGINEPVQFYVPSKAKQPYELVVNEVSKNTIKGYLATPKVTVSRNEPVAAN